MLNLTECPVGFLTSLGPTLASEARHLNRTVVEHALEEQLAASVLLSSCVLVVSLIVLFAGARLGRPTLFVSAFGITFLASAVGTGSILAAAPGLSPVASCVLLAAAPALLSLVAGCASLCLLNLGFAFLGAAAGAGVGALLYAAGLDAVGQETS